MILQFIFSAKTLDPFGDFTFSHAPPSPHFAHPSPAPNPRTALLNACGATSPGFCICPSVESNANAYRIHTVQYTVVPSVVIQAGKGRCKRPPRASHGPVSNNHAVRPRARMPSTARRVDSIRPLHLDSFRIGILRLSIRQLSASDGRGAWLSCMDTAALHARARAGGFKQAG